MYPVRLGYDSATQRIERLMEHGHHSEALVTSVFTVEKTLRRTLRQIVVSAGFASRYADKIVDNLRGLEALKEAWELYEPNRAKLTEIVPVGDWTIFKDAAEMRNKMVHGKRVYGLETCRIETKKVLDGLARLKMIFDQRYGYSGWKTLKGRIKSRLHEDPKVETAWQGWTPPSCRARRSNVSRRSGLDPERTATHQSKR
jgi:hypothetical protein